MPDMTPEQVKKQVLSLGDWEFWAERPFRAFIMSIFVDGTRRRYMKRAGMNVEWPATLFQHSAFYKSQKVWDKFAAQIEREIKAGRSSAFTVSRSCEKFWRDSIKKINAINKSHDELSYKLEQLNDIFSLDNSFVWLTHGLEHLYNKKLHQEIPKYYKGDIDKFIGDASYPTKKNAHHYLEAALRGKQPLEKVRADWGWIKVRDGFSEPFTVSELARERKRLRKTKPEKFKRLAVPPKLRPLFKVAQELVYLRTLRTDALFHLLYLARPTLKQVAKHYGIKFSDLRHYTIPDLIAGTPKRYSDQISFISWGPHFAFFNKPIYKEKPKTATELKGVIANPGKVVGRAKIVKTAYEIGKVKTGDILFAPTTAPSYIIGMKRAAAFVTDEGGITSHAAIVSREMGKPCIIGTKAGTRVFKDNDKVEVDADQGIVKKI